MFVSQLNNAMAASAAQLVRGAVRGQARVQSPRIKNSLIKLFSKSSVKDTPH
jgi:hypothetical protein